MKKIIILTCLLAVVVCVCAQRMPDYEGCNYIAIFEWQQGNDHLWHKNEGHRILRNTQMKIIAHDKKKKLLYAYDDRGCYEISLTENWNKYVSKEFDAKKIAENELNKAIMQIEREIDDKYLDMNNAIIAGRKAEQARNDSIQSELRKKHEAELSNYKKEHSFYNFDIKEFRNNCVICNENKFLGIIVPKRISGDSLTIFELKKGILGIMYSQFHMIELNYKDKNKLALYLEAYKDSLSSPEYTMDYISEYNKNEKEKYNTQLRKAAPNGVIDYFYWSLNSVCGIDISLNYLNTSSKIIKYVDIYFNVYNAVGDKCFLKYVNSYTGSIRGVGPIEPFIKRRWTWDASYYTTCDASEIKITKLVITYMDNTKKTLTGNAILYNEL